MKNSNQSFSLKLLFFFSSLMPALNATHKGTISAIYSVAQEVC